MAGQRNKKQPDLFKSQQHMEAFLAGSLDKSTATRRNTLNDYSDCVELSVSDFKRIMEYKASIYPEELDGDVKKLGIKLFTVTDPHTGEITWENHYIKRDTVEMMVNLRRQQKPYPIIKGWFSPMKMNEKPVLGFGGFICDVTSIKDDAFYASPFKKEEDVQPSLGPYEYSSDTPLPFFVADDVEDTFPPLDSVINQRSYEHYCARVIDVKKDTEMIKVKTTFTQLAKGVESRFYLTKLGIILKQEDNHLEPIDNKKLLTRICNELESAREFSSEFCAIIKFINSEDWEAVKDSNLSDKFSKAYLLAKI